MKPIIEVQNISKKFIINHERQEYLSFRDSIANLFKPSKKQEEFYALNNVSFNVEKGDTFGIIGKNGAGKSTLLKILSKITPPTKGKVIGRGRVASLLEVGTGFHPELTGRENIFMNGSILGMKKSEILKNFDAIVDFSGVEKFIDTPLKRYSSGMQLRLAFAVAAFLENEVLVIDEVLAVGDAEFQRKCIGKMGDISYNEGRTLLFVSHNIAALKTLCKNGILLSNGTLTAIGNIHQVISKYQGSNISFNNQIINFEDNIGNKHIKPISISVKPINGDTLSISSGICFELRFYNYSENSNIDSTWELVNDDETIIFHQGALITQNNDSKKGIYIVKFNFPPYTLNSNRYYINLIFGKNQRELLYKQDRIYHFEIINDEALGSNMENLPGVLRPKIDFNVAYE
ncbi:MAG: ABC transporter ATP-binding protein [Bacteroidia bacterium]|nr:ABC transporter ATP-binding protein [Bacteroidia bacterium]